MLQGVKHKNKENESEIEVKFWGHTLICARPSQPRCAVCAVSH